MNNKRPNVKKSLMIVTTVIIVVVCGYFSFAYAFNKWPFALLTIKTDSVNEQKPSSIISINEIITNRANGTLEVKTPVDTTEQGDCTMTLVSKTDSKSKYTFTNSTKGIEGQKGCLSWNIGVLAIPSGQYEMTVTFKGPTKSATTSRTVAIVQT